MGNRNFVKKRVFGFRKKCILGAVKWNIYAPGADIKKLAANLFAIVQT